MYLYYDYDICRYIKFSRSTEHTANFFHAIWTVKIFLHCFDTNDSQPKYPKTYKDIIIMFVATVLTWVTACIYRGQIRNISPLSVIIIYLKLIDRPSFWRVHFSSPNYPIRMKCNPFLSPTCHCKWSSYSQNNVISSPESEMQRVLSNFLRQYR